jgi:hypothetical protein
VKQRRAFEDQRSGGNLLPGARELSVTAMTQVGGLIA